MIIMIVWRENGRSPFWYCSTKYCVSKALKRVKAATRSLTLLFKIAPWSAGLIMRYSKCYSTSQLLGEDYYKVIM